MTPRLHFNYSAAAPMAAETRQAIDAHFDLEAALGPVEAAGAVAPRLAEIHRAAERLIGATPGGVALTEGQGRAMALVAAGLRLQPGDRILCAPSEWGGTVSALTAAAHAAGASVAAIPMRPDHTADLDALRRMLDGQVRLISVTQVSVSGTAVQPVREIAELARSTGALLAVDASQSIGWLPVEMAATGIDILTASGRKYLRGPRGVALLGLSARAQAALTPPPPDDFAVRQSDALRWETAEYPYATRLGFGVALDQALAFGVDALGAELLARATRLEAALQQVPGLRLIRPEAQDRSAVAPLVAFEIEGRDPVAVQKALHGMGINIAANMAAYAPYFFAHLGKAALLRASVHLPTTDDDIARLVAALVRV